MLLRANVAWEANVTWGANVAGANVIHPHPPHSHPVREFFEPKIFWNPGSVRYAASSGYRLVFLAYHKLFPSTLPVFRPLFLFSDHASGFPTTLPVFRSHFCQNQNKSAKLSSIEEISRVLNKFVFSWRKIMHGTHQEKF